VTRHSFWFALFTLFLAAPSIAATVTVTSADDSVTANDGKVTLREAIGSINAGNDLGDPDITAQAPGTFGTSDTINFNIAGAGVHLITTTSSLTAINKKVFINGYSQPGSSANTNAFNAGINAVLLIEISGVPGGAVLDILAADTEVRGLAIHGGTNIVAASGVVIAGNFLGTDAAGTTALGLAGTGYCVQVVSFGSTIPGNVIIGGPAAADRNLIVGAGIGVQLPFISPGPGTGYVIQGNYIGTDISGTLALGRGLGMDAITNALVTGNLISGNPSGAIAQLLDNNTVQGNLIGTQRDGATPLPNGGNGVEISGGNSIIGGSGAGEANVIANSAGGGVVIYNAQTQGSSNINTHNRISRNSIYANGLLGISLVESSFVLANDAGDADTWAADNVGNDGQNYPVLTSAVLNGSNVSVSGTLNSLANASFTLEFFANASCDASGHGEGQTYIGTAATNTDGSGNASFGPLSFAVPAGQSAITSTATDAAGNTSEFSACQTATGGPAATTTAVISSLNPSVFGQTVTFTATVTGNNPTGTVQFKDGGTTLGSPAMLSSAMATLTTSALSIGTHPITAVYSGDANNNASTSLVLNQVVTAVAPSATTTTLVSSLNPSNFGQSVTFTATVSGASPTGSVSFDDNGTLLGSGSVSAGNASLTTSTLAVGSHPITATYGGDPANSASSSSILTQVVTTSGGGGAGPPVRPAPTLSQWVLLVLLGLLGAAGLRRLGRRGA
jgi:hypothetical protein